MDAGALSISFSAMSDSNHEDANAFIVYPSQDAIGANPVPPKIAVLGPLHSGSDLAWVGQLGQTILQKRA